MDAKLKAKELVEKFTKQPIHAATLHMVRNKPEFRMDFQSAKQCALIAVEEIMILMNQILDAFESESDGYWEKVKNEIQQL